MKLKFDANQPYQLEAINAIVDIFDGQPTGRGDFETTIKFASSPMFKNRLGYGNSLEIDRETIQKNLIKIQKQNRIFQPHSLQSKGLNFSVEMETGTGKTYVYLRTILEFNCQYAFNKFIIVVPSVAIREGVLKSIDIMKEHFRELYNNVPFSHFVYNSKDPASLRSFATGNALQIMIINIDSFNKKENNIIHDYRDKMGGYKPIEFIRATNPIVIMDEPQNMESQKAKEAIASLNPLCTLRYSATHRDKYNLVYQLNPVQAFQQKLVKKISVVSVLADNDPNQAYLKVESITNRNGRFSVKLKYFKQGAGGLKIISGSCKQNDDLFIKSGEYGIYQNGFIISEINARPGMEFVRFTNGIRLVLGQEQGGNKDVIIKKQIRETIKTHFEKELQLHGMGIKVLTLFFLDRVENYRIHTDSGNVPGKYALWFEEIYSELAGEYRNLFTKTVPVETVHDGYFSKDRKGNFKNSTTGKSKDDESTYNLIMREKEKLLDLNNPLKFIFSHSALREGWDNPNVFQICTLNETKSTLKKRQEIGRGLRLPVNQEGERIFDDYINNLVVISNESYQDFVETLQKEFQDECGVVFGRLPREAFVGLSYTLDDEEKIIKEEDSAMIWEHLHASGLVADDGFILSAFSEVVEDNSFTVPESFKVPQREIMETIEQHQINRLVTKHNPVRGKVNSKVLLDPEFEKFWKAISAQTIYSVTYSTDELIEKAADSVKRMDRIDPPRIRTTLADISVKDKGVSALQVRTPETTYTEKSQRVPDILSYIQSKVELTRSTIYEILQRSGRLDDFLVNPQSFMDLVAKEIKQVLHRMIIKGIQYEKLDAVSYEMSKFREDEHKLEFAQERIVPTQKSVYDYITFDSGVEKKFAQELEHMKDIKYFIKLPNWFKVPTPVGDYNPDWAILKQNGDIVYMIRETKSTKDKRKLRLPENDKIACGCRHFESICVDYAVASSVEDAF